MPAVLGAGAGDVAEVLAAGRHLRRAGFSLTLYRRAGRPLPPGVVGPWAWPPHARATALRPRGRAALTLSSSWGVTAAPGTPGPLGRPGPWSEEAAEIERAYGHRATLHVSLEEFARTLTSRRGNLERLREGGVAGRAAAGTERDEFARAYRRFRAFGTDNVLHLFPTFRYDRAFAREFPEAVQTGPLWRRGAPGRPGRPRRGGRDWVWYASPASAERIAPAVADGLGRGAPAARLRIRSPRAWRTVPPGPRVVLRSRASSEAAWRREFRSAAGRIVTGSRSLLEALELGGPFLYFNGVLGTGPAQRRHRPEKILGFLRIARDAGWPRDLLRDLADFSRGRRVAEVAARAARRTGGWRRFPPAPAPVGFRPPFDDPARLLTEAARILGRAGSDSVACVAELRRRSNR